MMEKLLERIVAGDAVESMLDELGAGLENEKKDALEVVVDSYFRLRQELEKVGKVAETLGLTFKISITLKLSFHFDWDAKAAPLWLTLSRDGHLNSTLLAFPPTAMRTDTYGPFYFGGTPPAASLLKVTEEMMLFVSDESTPPDELLEKLNTQEEEAPYILPVTHTTRRGPLIEVHLTDPVCVDVCAEPSNEEILEIIWGDMPDIHLIGIVTSGYPSKEYIPRKDVATSLSSLEK